MGNAIGRVRRRKKAILFDLDGVLIETEWETFLFYKDYLEKHYSINLPDDAFQHKIGRKSSDFWGRVLLENQRRIVDTKKLTLLKRELFNKYPDKYIKKIPGGKELVDSLKAVGWKTALATQNEERMMRTVLEWLGMSNVFDINLSLEDIIHKKPHPEIYLKAAKLLGVDSVGCVVIEDSEDGIAAAKNAGMYCIAMKHPYTPLYSLKNADDMVLSLRDITVEMLAAL